MALSQRLGLSTGTEISSEDWDLQRTGYAAALKDPANVPLDGSVAIGVVQWSTDQRVEQPLTKIDSVADRDKVISAIEGMSQYADGTGSGAGVAAGTAEVVAHGRSGVRPVLCMSTDGTTNEGPSLTTTVAAAKAAGVQQFSVVGIEDGFSASAAVLRAHYGPHVFGGGAVTIARDTSEFATLIGGSCFGTAVRLRALEVSQGVQNWHNATPVVAGHDTVVRAFVETPDGEPNARVTGRLVGTRNGSPLPGSPLAAVNSGSAVLAREDIASRREALTDSLNFLLPKSWADGNVTLEFQAGGNAVDCKEPSGGGSANDCLVSMNFDETTEVGVSFFKIKVGSSEPSGGDMSEQIARVRSALPISELNTTVRTKSYASTPSLDKINADLLKIKEVERSSCTGACVSSARDRYYGVFEPARVPVA